MPILGTQFSQLGAAPPPYPTHASSDILCYVWFRAPPHHGSPICQNQTSLDLSVYIL